MLGSIYGIVSDISSKVQKKVMGVNNTAVVTVIPKSTETEIPSGDIIHLSFASCDLDDDKKQKWVKGDAKITKESTLTEYKYKAGIDVPEGFGEIGAVIVELIDDSSSVERFIDNISITNSTSQDTINFSCTSWVQPKRLIPDRRRIFFSTKSYLPLMTPKGLKDLRNEDLENLKGVILIGGERKYDEKERQAFERIYAYDFYNDLGDPGRESKWKRPVLGGTKYPYPRRCRTGRPHYSNPDYSSSETRGEGSFYVPRDEEFSEKKQKMFPPNPDKKEKMGTTPFKNFTQINLMFEDAGIKTPKDAHEILSFDIASVLSSFVESPEETTAPTTIQPAEPTSNSTTKFPPPEAFKRDKFNWLSDIEFARQTLAGINPYCIQLVKDLPLKSELPTKEYGPQESAFTTELVQKLIGTDSIPVDKALLLKKLYVVDFHDTLMPFVSKVRGITGTTLYGSRALFFLNSDDTLKPLGIELTGPLMDEKPQWKKVFTAGATNAKDAWLWRLAKAHVLAHDSCVHQLVTHWLRTHCCMEPYAIALHRQLSTMHPIYRLLHPHFRFNMRINANARQFLINAGGIIETTFSAADYSMELSSLVYKNEWQFDSQAFPEDLIRRGMAERDQHGSLILAIKDYPFANDGLMLWDALLAWVKEYVNHYYKNDGMVTDDSELKWWWNDIMKKGHPDKKSAAGWPELTNVENLIKIVSTIAWVGCGHHSAVNFVQYAHAAYFPNRPSIARTNMPIESSDKIKENFIENPEAVLLDAFPSMAQATTVAQTMMLLSAHSEDEEYIGKDIKPEWAADPNIADAFENFKTNLEDLETTIKERNKDPNLKNRRGPGLVPYEVFNPTSEPGITGKGVPYSVST